MDPYIIAAGAYAFGVAGFIAHLRSTENKKEIDKMITTIEKMKSKIETLEKNNK